MDRRRRSLAGIFVIVGLLCLGGLTRQTRAAQADVPYLTGRVVDLADIIDADIRGRIAEQLREHERTTTNQIVVLTVPSLESTDVETYADTVFKAWKLGAKGRDNGVLFVIAPKDRKMRIEVGYGLEGTLTDATCGRIIRDVITPRFRDEQYGPGIEAGVTAAIGVLTGQGALPEPSTDGASTSTPADLEHGIEGPWYVKVLLGAFVFGIIGLFTVVGLMTPGVGWFLYVFLIPFWAVFPMVVIGAKPALALLAVYVIGFPITKLRLKRMPWYGRVASDLRTKGSSSIGGFTITSSGSSSSGGWSSFGGGGGGFSGGGGCSGGGGASGSW